MLELLSLSILERNFIIVNTVPSNGDRLPAVLLCRWGLVAEFIPELVFHLVTKQVELRRVDEGMHLPSVWYDWLWSDLVSREEFRHAGLAVRHVYFESCVSRSSVQHYLSLPCLQRLLSLHKRRCCSSCGIHRLRANIWGSAQILLVVSTPSALVPR